MSVVINGSAGVTTNSGAVYDGIQRGTAVTASGTSVDFTSIPSWVRRITVMFSVVSTNGSSNFQIQIGSGSVITSGYVSRFSSVTTGINATSSGTTGILFANTGSTLNHNGWVQFTLVTGNTWVAGGVLGSNFPAVIWTSGEITLGGTLDRLRVTTVNGTDTFDAGTINILFE